MARVSFLADTSVFARLSKPPVVAAFSPLVAAGQVAICAPVAFELGYSARSIDDYNSLIERLGAFPSVPVSDTDHRRALELQEALAHRGHHRALSLVDALVASVGAARGLEILHYDADFELLAGVTGQGQRWIVERGTAD